MNILITGSDSQITAPFENSSANYNILKLTRLELDITDYNKMKLIFDNFKPDIILNFAAYTKVDLAEIEIDKAYNVNMKGVKNLSLLSNIFKCFLIHISTDYVFDGDQNIPYVETDQTNPLSIYGKSKLAGENEIINISEKYLIIRVSWLYGIYKKNFLTFILQNLKKSELSVVNNQYGLPTNVFDLSKIIHKIILKIKDNNISKNLFHYSNIGEPISWFDFANYILFLSESYESIKTTIKPIKSIDFFKNNIRPSYTALNSDKIANFLDIPLIDWKVSLKKSIQMIYHS